MEVFKTREIKELDYLNKEINELYHAISLKIGISDSACIVFYAMLEMGENCRQTDIAEQYSVRRQTINSTIKNLETEGYLRKTPGKGREIYLSLTPKGKTFAEKHIVPIFAMENNAFAAMTETERKELLRLTRKYVAIFTRATKEFLAQD